MAGRRAVTLFLSKLFQLAILAASVCGGARRVDISDAVLDVVMDMEEAEKKAEQAAAAAAAELEASLDTAEREEAARVQRNRKLKVKCWGSDPGTPPAPGLGPETPNH